MTAKKVFIVAAHEYLYRLRSRRFYYSLLSMPLIVFLVAGLVYIMVNRDNDHSPVAYLDDSGLTQTDQSMPLPKNSESTIPFIAFYNKDYGLKELAMKKVQAFFIIPKDFRKTGEVEVYFYKNPAASTLGQFEDFIKINLLVDKPPKIAYRIVKGQNWIVRSVDGKREIFANPTFNQIILIVLSLGFVIMVFANSGDLMQAMAKEKENRTMEILITSVSVQELLAGKIWGFVALSLTMIGGWLIFWSAAIHFLAQVAGIKWFAQIHLPLVTIGSFIVLALPTYIIFAAIMVSLGVSVTESEEGKQTALQLMILLILPYFFFMPIIKNPDSILAIILTLFPVTALAAFSLRDTFTQVPFWQIACSASLAITGAAWSMKLASKAVEMGILKYNQRIHLGKLLFLKKNQQSN